jgi:hypothetical protein
MGGVGALGEESRAALFVYLLLTYCAVTNFVVGQCWVEAKARRAASINAKQKSTCYFDVCSAIVAQARFHEALHTSEDR